MVKWVRHQAIHQTLLWSVRNMNDSQMENFNTNEGRGRKTLFVVVIIIGFIVVFVLAALIITKIKDNQSKKTPASVGVVGGNEVANEVEGEKNVPSLPNVPSIPAGIDRPLTDVEKKKYGFKINDDIWVKTSSPTDGSQPFMSFYNKTVNPNPYPTVPVFIHHE